jgi:hypothetical protein
MQYIAVVDGSGVADAEQQQGATRGVLQEARCEMQRHGLMASPGRPVAQPEAMLVHAYIPCKEGRTSLMAVRGLNERGIMLAETRPCQYCNNNQSPRLARFETNSYLLISLCLRPACQPSAFLALPARLPRRLLISLSRRVQ